MVSVVVCAYNEEELIGECLEALAGQTYPFDRYEVLVIDDESTDRTAAIADDVIGSSYPGGPAVHLIRIAHGGLSVARNEGIRRSRGAIVAFTDSDAVADPDWLVELVKPFREGADYVGGRIDLLNVDSRVARLLQSTRNRQLFGPRVYQDAFIGCNMAIRREALEAVGRFDSVFVARGDETALHDRLSERYTYRPAPAARVLHMRPESIWAAVRTEWRSATLGRAVAQAGRKGARPREWYAVVEQGLVAALPPCLLAAAVVPGTATFACAGIAALAFFRRAFVRPLGRANLSALIEERGVLRGLSLHLAYEVVKSAITAAGRIVGRLRTSAA